MAWLFSSSDLGDDGAPWNALTGQQIGSLAQRIADASASLQDAQAALAEPEHPAIQRDICWGAKVSLRFKMGVLWIEQQLGLHADFLMACMAFETGGTFSPSVKNGAGSSGTGLIQFMASTAKSLGTTVTELAAMDAVKQLSYVYRYFERFDSKGHDLSDWGLEDTYMAILYPAAIGKPIDWALPWKYGSLAYQQNAGLDLNRDEVITKAEAAAGPRKKLTLGNQFRG
jgi:hypothetical protein